MKVASGKWQVASKKLQAAGFFFLLVTCHLPLATPVLAMIGDPLAMSNPQYLFELSYADAEQAIGRMLSGKGAGSPIVATIEGHRNGGLFSYSKPLSVEVKGLQFDKGTGHW